MKTGWIKAAAVGAMLLGMAGGVCAGEPASAPAADAPAPAVAPAAETPVPEVAAAPAETAAAIAPEARQVLEAFAAYLKGLDTFRVGLRSRTHIQAEGLKQEMEVAYQLAVARPDKLALRRTAGLKSGTVVSDGKKLYSYLPVAQKFIVQEAPKTLAGIGDASEIWPMISAQTLGGLNLLDILVADDPLSLVMERSQRVEYLGTEDIDGVSCDHLRVSQEELDWQVWIARSERPLLRRVMPDLEKALKAGAGEMMPLDDMRMSMTLDLVDWDTQPDLPAAEFSFEAPAGSEEAASFFGEEPAEPDYFPTSEDAPAPGEPKTEP